jgi:hypothetical protein
VLTGLGLRWLFVADAATCLACALLVGLHLPGTPVSGHPDAAVWRDRCLLLMLATGTVFAIVYLQLVTALPSPSWPTTSRCPASASSSPPRP